ncbi:mitochondrial translation initiation [Lasallia pustulata]|nr:mitochondrial translation initiation [Lasallia pustulata]
MAAPASSSESSENVPQEAESKSWTRWTPLESHEQPSQPGQSSPPKTPSVLDDIRSEPTNAGRDQQREDISYNKTRRRAGDFDIEPPIQSAEYELNRFDRDRNRPKRSRQFVQEYDEEEDYVAKRADRKRQRKKDKAVQRAAAPPTPIILPEFISIANLASALRVRTEDFARKMTELGFEEAGTDHVLDAETAGLIATEFNFEPIVDRTESEDLQARPQAEDKSSLPPRPPVVTIMGHVDHGKTTLLDWLRKSSVAASEHGGITQHIGAFSVSMPSGRMITFLDTPGHAAFLSMRQRGANVTDIVILVVAADDSVKPQTIEAIHHAKAAKVPIIVAVNKIDKEDANVERVKLDLGRHGIEVEDFGGDTQVVCVSGKTGQGMDELEDAALALADILDMRAETDGPAEGWVLEATTKKAGRVATVLVRRGTMHPGDVIVAGNTWARVRSLRNEAGMQVPSAGPGSPVEVDGWREQPAAGDEVLQAPDEQKAKSVVEWRLELTERIQLASDVAAVNETRRLEQEKREREDQSATTGVDGEEAPAPPEPASAGVKEVFFIVKADVSGSVEAVLNSISALGNSEVRAHVLRSGVGTVTEFDVEHAAAAKGHVLAFNTVVDVNISRMAEAAGVGVLESNIIYRLIEDVRAILEEQLPPLTFQKVVGEAEVAQVFEISVKGRVTMPVAGCRVRNGVMTRNSKVRVLRDKEAVFDGTLSSLRHVKKDVTEMRKGSECGIGFENWTDFQVGDQVQCYEEKTEKRTF